MGLLIALCDISRENLKTLRRQILDFDDTIEVRYFDNGDSIIASKDSYDAIFFNYDPKDKGSLDMAVKFRIHRKSTPFILYSPDPRSADHSSGLHIAKALRFPIQQQVLNEILRMIRSRSRDNEEYVLSTQEGTRRVKAGRIVYVDGRAPLPVIHLTDGETIEPVATMDSLTSLFADDMFARIHKHYIVSLRYINELYPNHLTMQYLDVDIPIGRKYRDDIKERFYKEIRSRAVIL